jgi:hypothetical protein
MKPTEFKGELIDYGVIPNMKDKDESVVEFLETRTWFYAMTKAVQKHSEMMRPWENDYPRMEYDYPYPDGMVPDQPLGGSEPGLGAYSCSHCYFTISKEYPHGENGNDCLCQLCFPYSSSFCMTPEDTEKYVEGTLELLGGFLNSYAASTWTWGITKSSDEEEIPTLVKVKGGDKLRGAFMCLEPKGGEWPIGRFEVTVWATDMYGNKCSAKEIVECEVDCCDPETYVDPEIDTIFTPDTIAPGGDVTVSLIEGQGCPPFSWSVAGAGYSVASAKTSGYGNTVSLVEGDCGSAAGQAGPVGTVTVTDDCGTTVSWVLRSTDGEWASQGGCTYSFAHGCTNCDHSLLPAESRYIIVDDTRFGFASTSSLTCYRESSGSTWGASCTIPDPPCGSPTQCCAAVFPDYNDCAGAGCAACGVVNCLLPYYWYDLWECP